MMHQLSFFSGLFYTVVNMLHTDPLDRGKQIFLPEGTPEMIHILVVLFCLVSRAEIADGIENLFFLVPDKTIIIPAPPLNEKTTGKRHTHRVSRFIKDKHGECGYQVVEEAVFRIPEVRVAFTRILPCKNAIRKHLAEFVECFRVMDRISHPCKRPGVVQGKELVVFAKELFAEIGADRFTVRGGKLINLAVQPAPDDLEIKHRVALDFMDQEVSQFSFGPGCFESDNDIPDHPASFFVMFGWLD
jgi:hypothetical protein